MPIGLKRVDHVCMAVWKIDDQLPFFTDLFGWKEAGRFTNEKEGFAGCVLDVPGADGQWQMQWEILEPIGDDGFPPAFDQLVAGEVSGHDLQWLAAHFCFTGDSIMRASRPGNGRSPRCGARL